MDNSEWGNTVVAVPTIPRIVSADDHLVEPPHLWMTRLPGRYRDVAPRVVRQRGRLAMLEGDVAVIHALLSNNSAAALVDWLCAAVPVRFPGLRLCLAESNR